MESADAIDAAISQREKVKAKNAPPEKNANHLPQSRVKKKRIRVTSLKEEETEEREVEMKVAKVDRKLNRRPHLSTLAAAAIDTRTTTTKATRVTVETDRDVAEAITRETTTTKVLAKTDSRTEGTTTEEQTVKIVTKSQGPRDQDSTTTRTGKEMITRNLLEEREKIVLRMLRVVIREAEADAVDVAAEETTEVAVVVTTVLLVRIEATTELLVMVLFETISFWKVLATLRNPCTINNNKGAVLCVPRTLCE